MEITVDELLQGRATKIKGKNYFETRAYIEPFLERMSNFTSDFRCQAILPDQITTNTERDDITYNRVWIQAVLPNDLSIDNHKQVVGMIYGLDCRKPIVKFYSGGLNMACTNLCVFNPDFLDVKEIEPEKAINFKPVTSLMEKTDTLATTLRQLQNNYLSTSESSINEELGKWIRNAMGLSYDSGYGKVKLATSLVLDAYKDLYVNTDSKYYMDINSYDQIDLFTIHNAFTWQITQDTKDIINKFEKTLLISRILGLDI